MPKTFDATTKELLASDPRGWAELLLGRPLPGVSILNADLSTITAEADTVLLVEDEPSWLVHVEFQTRYDPALPRRLQRYNVLLNYRHDRPVRSIVLLLCKEADGPAISGLLQQRLPDGFLYSEFHYGAVRIWECPAAEILGGELAVIPLAPLAKMAEGELATIVQTIHRRLDEEATPAVATTIWLATYLLMGLRYSEKFVDQLIQGVQGMRESTTYRKIVEEGRVEGRIEGRVEGRVEEARRIVKRQGIKRFGKPASKYELAIDAIADLDRLELLSERLLDAKSWQELLGDTANGHD